MSGLRGWLFTIYLFRASPLWNTHYFSHLLSMNYSSSFVSCLCDLFHGLVRKWWLMGRAWQSTTAITLALLGVKPQFQGLSFLCTKILILVPELNTPCLLLSAYRPLTLAGTLVWALPRLWGAWVSFGVWNTLASPLGSLVTPWPLAPA